MSRLQRAVEQAKLVQPAFKMGVRMWAGIWHATKLIASGAASSKTHPLQARFATDPTRIFMHAEIAALAAYQRRLRVDSTTPKLSDCLMIVARVKKDGSIGLAKPCEGCQLALIEFEIGEIEWTEET